MPEPESSAAPTEAAAVAPAESAPAVASPIPEGFDLESAFSLRALSASPAVAAPAVPAVEGEPAQPEAVASTPDDQDQEPVAEGATSEPKLSRRQQAEAERQAEIAAARAEWEAERQRADSAERENAVLREAEQKRVAAYVERMGDDREFNRLNGLPSSSLSYEEQTLLDQWKLNRTDRDLLEQDATNRVLNVQAAEVQRVSKALAGVDPDAVRQAPSFGAIYEHFYEAGGKAVRAELQDQIAQLEADNRALRAQRLGQARQPEAGGASPASTQANPNTWPTHLTADEDLAAAFSVGPRNGRR